VQFSDDLVGFAEDRFPIPTLEEVQTRRPSQYAVLGFAYDTVPTLPGEDLLDETEEFRR